MKAVYPVVIIFHANVIGLMATLSETAIRGLTSPVVGTFGDRQAGNRSVHLRPVRPSSTISISSRRGSSVFSVRSRDSEFKETTGDGFDVPVAEELSEIGPIVVLTYMMQIFMMTHSDWGDFSEDEFLLQMSLFQKSISKLQAIILDVTKTIARRHGLDREAIMEGGTVVAEALAEIPLTPFVRWSRHGGRRPLLDDLNVLATWQVELFEAYVLDVWARSGRAHLSQSYPNVRVLSDVIDFQEDLHYDEIRLLHIALLTVAMSCPEQRI